MKKVFYYPNVFLVLGTAYFLLFVPEEYLLSACATPPKRPVAMVWADGQLCIANQRAGSLSVVDVASWKAHELPGVGESLTDLVVSEDQRWLVVVDAGRAELVWLRRDGPSFVVAKRQSTATDPQKAVWKQAAGWAAITCRWSKRVVLYRVTAVDQWTEMATVALPFAPREAVFLDDQRLVVADAFGGQLAIIDVHNGLCHTHRLTGHNLWGLTLSPRGDRVLLNMQRLNSFRPTSYEDIFWGGVMQNMMVELKRRDVLQPPREEPIEESVYFLGRPSEGTGDPTALFVSHDGFTVVALGGIHQVAIRQTPYAPFEYRAVGKRPIAVCRVPGENSVFVLCQMDDTVYELDLDRLEVTRYLELTPDFEQDEVAVGESLFYDATLALDGWFSCHSCHTDGHTTGLLNDNFGDNSQGAPKRIPSLRGTADTGPWAWNGRMETLEAQVRKSLLQTMQAGRADDETVAALVAFVRSLAPVQSPPEINQSPASLRERGAMLFSERRCADCHQPPTYTTPEVYDVNIYDQVGNTMFNPPSLRGIYLRDAFFHDNRATSLSDVFLKHGHPADTVWTEEDVQALVAFLRSL